MHADGWRRRSASGECARDVTAVTTVPPSDPPSAWRFPTLGGSAPEERYDLAVGGWAGGGGGRGSGGGAESFSVMDLEAVIRGDSDSAAAAAVDGGDAVLGATPHPHPHHPPHLAAEVGGGASQSWSERLGGLKQRLSAAVQLQEQGAGGREHREPGAAARYAKTALYHP